VAEASLGQVEETLRLLKLDLAEIPASVDEGDFIISGARSRREKKKEKSPTPTLAKLFSVYEEELPEGAKEESTLVGERIHCPCDGSENKNKAYAGKLMSCRKLRGRPVPCFFTLTDFANSCHNSSMASIEFSEAKFRQLSEQAAAAGYSDVAAFVEALADEAAFDPRCGMTDELLRQSAAECDRINETMKAGGGQDAREAFAKLGEEFGFGTPE